MGNLAVDRLDEAHCLWALCPHPCCWEAEQRIAKGIPRRVVGSPTKHCPTSEESLPCLSVVDVSEWPGSRKHPEQRFLCKTNSSHNSEPKPSAYSFPHLPLLLQKERFKSAGTSLPAFNSAGQRASGTREKEIKLSPTRISPLIGSESSPWGLGSLVLWVPNPRRIPRCHTLKRSTSPHCTVKEIICLPACTIQKTSKASGGSEGPKKRVRFQLPCLPLTSHLGHTSSASLEQGPGLEAQLDPTLVDSPSDGEKPGSMVGPGLPPTEHGVSSDPTSARESSPFLMNKPVVLHSVQERAAKRASKDAPTSFYKLDSKTGEESIDWERLKGQVYLWKRYNLPQQKECRDKLCPPGAAKPLETLGLGSAPKASLQPPLQNQLSVAPGVWYCVKGIWHYQQQQRGPSTAAETHTLPTTLDSTVEAKHCCTLLHRMPDTGERSKMQKGVKGAVTPLKSTFCWHSAQTQHDGECEGPGPQGAQAAVIPTVEAVPRPRDASGRSVRFFSGALEPWRGMSSSDSGPDHRGHQLPTPPPSLSSL